MSPSSNTLKFQNQSDQSEQTKLLSTSQFRHYTALPALPALLLKIILPLATLLFLQACAVPAAKKPTPYNGPDTVGTFTADDIVGTWRMTLLSVEKTPDDPVALVTINADGTAVATTTPPEGAEINFAFESSGTWEIAGDQLKTAMTEMREVSGNRAAAFIGGFASRFISKDQLSGTANPYVLTAERMVLVDDEGYALQYDRVSQ